MRDRSQARGNSIAGDMNPSSTARLPSFTEEELAGVREQKNGMQASGASFDLMGPDIDSPEIDELIQKYRSTHGEPKLDMKQLKYNIEGLRKQLGSLRGA